MQKDSRVVQRNKKHFLIHSIALSLISAPVNGCVLMWCIQQFWLKNMTAITDPTFRRTWCGFFEPVFWDATDFARTQGQYSCLCSFSAMVHQKGYDSSAFQQFFNSDQLNSFIANHQQDAASQYAAKRLLQQYPNVAFQSVVTKISQGKKNFQI